MHIFVSTRGSLYGISDGTRLCTNCARTNVFIPFGFVLSEKQIPRFVGNVSS
jgi:hypothetical protein